MKTKEEYTNNNNIYEKGRWMTALKYNVQQFIFKTNFIIKLTDFPPWTMCVKYAKNTLFF